jgi:hypothetical protein
MTNIAMENPHHKWRFLAWKIICKWAIYTMAMLNNQRVFPWKDPPSSMGKLFEFNHEIFNHSNFHWNLGKHLINSDSLS